MASLPKLLRISSKRRSSPHCKILKKKNSELDQLRDK